MKIRCSSCSTVFGIPDERLAGRTGKLKVRCPKCSSVLAVQAPELSDAPAPPEEEEAVWYYAHEDEQKGPVSLTRVKTLLSDGTISGESLVWRPGAEEWSPATSFEELAGAEQVSQETVEAPEADPAETFTDQTMELDISSIDESVLKDSEEPEEPEAEAHDSQDEDAILQELDEEDDSIEIPPGDDDGEPEDFSVPEAEHDLEEDIPTEPALSELTDEVLEEIGEGDEADGESGDDEDALGKAHDLLSRVGISDDEEEESVQDEHFEPEVEPPTADQEEEDDGGGLFAGFDGDGEAEEDSPEAESGSMVHTRRETSVLFSLDDFVQEDEEKEEASTSEPTSSEDSEDDDSGLIDIREIAAQEEEEPDEDLFASFGSEDGPSQPVAAAAPGSAAMPILKKKKKWPKVLGIVVAVLVVLGGGAVGAYAFFSKVNPEDVKQKLEASAGQAFKSLSDRVSALQDEHLSQLQEARKEKEKLVRTQIKNQDDRLEQIREQKLKELEAVRSEHSAELAKLDTQRKTIAGDLESARNRLTAAEKELEALRKARELAADDTESKAEEKAEEKAEKKKAEPRKYTAEERRRYRELKKKRAEERRKAAAEKEKKEAQKKKEEKKVVEKKEETGDKKGKDILAILDKKGKDGAGTDGSAKPKKKNLTTRDVMKAVNGSKGAMRQCFKKYGGGLDSATIRTKVTINGSGRVTRVAISSMQYAGTALGNCVSKVQKRMKFPAFAKPSITKSISVRLP